MVKMVNFILCAFYHNEKKFSTSGKYFLFNRHILKLKDNLDSRVLYLLHGNFKNYLRIVITSKDFKEKEPKCMTYAPCGVDF